MEIARLIDTAINNKKEKKQKASQSQSSRSNSSSSAAASPPFSMPAASSSSLSKLSSVSAESEEKKKSPATGEPSIEFEVALYQGEIETVRSFLKEGKVDVKQIHPRHLLLTSDLGNLKLVEFLVTECKANVNQADQRENTPLRIAASKGHHEIVKYLLDEGKADINKADQDRSTPLMAAAKNGKLEVVKLLLARGANKNLRNKNGKTASEMAKENGYEEIEKLIIQYKSASSSSSSSASAAASSSASAPHAASSSSSSGLCLSSAASDPVPQKNKNEKLLKSAEQASSELIVASIDGNLELVRSLLECKADANYAVQSLRGVTPLLLASQIDHSEIVKLLVNEGKADVNKANMFGITPLFMAAATNHLKIVEFLVQDCKADIDKADIDGTTPLLIASEANRPDVAKLLLALGANKNLRNKNGETASDVAMEKGHHAIANLISQYMPPAASTSSPSTVMRDSLHLGIPLHSPPPTDLGPLHQPEIKPDNKKKRKGGKKYKRLGHGKSGMGDVD